MPYEGLARMTNAGPRWTGRIAVMDGTGWDELKRHEAPMYQPLRWKKPRLIFVNSMSDLFHEAMAESDIDQILGIMLLAQRHTFQVLTKRPQRMVDYLNTPGRMLDVAEAAARLAFRFFVQGPHKVPADVAIQLATKATDSQAVLVKAEWPLRNVWWGTSAEDPDSWAARVPLLTQVPGPVRWVSLEPMLAPVVPLASQAFLNWVVVGGESGPGARPMAPAWARFMRDWCLEWSIPFFFKQWGEWAPADPGTYLASVKGHQTRVVDGTTMMAVGKEVAGEYLDGRTWQQLPMVAAEGRLG